MAWLWAVWALAGYACGSVPCAWLIGRAHGLDIREHGSGNVGATNVGRILGRRWGSLCFALDVFKGFVPVFAAGMAMDVASRRAVPQADAWAWMAVAAAAVVGHVFPVWLRFRGGKGVATGFGVLLGLGPLWVPGVAAALTWVLVVGSVRRVSVASVVASVSIPIYLSLMPFATHDKLADLQPFLIVSSLLAALVVARHRSNLARVLAGTEPKLGEGPECGRH